MRVRNRRSVCQQIATRGPPATSDGSSAEGENDALEDVGGVDLVFDVIGGDIQKRSAGLIRAGGTPVAVVRPTSARLADGGDHPRSSVSDTRPLVQAASRRCAAPPP
jgi:hypothetical protein